MAKLKIQKTANGITVDSYVSPTTINGTNIGGTGGNNDQTVPTIKISFLKDATGAVDAGYILTQKGQRQFRVNNTSEANTTVVSLVNRLSTELTVADTATILATTTTLTGANVANIGTGSGSYTNNRAYAYITYAAANVAGYSTPTVGYQIAGSGLTGNITVVEVNSTGNITVSCATQTVATAQATMTQTFNVSHISNKFVWDWSNTKYRYYFGNPYSDGAGTPAGAPTWAATTLIKVDND